MNIVRRDRRRYRVTATGGCYHREACDMVMEWDHSRPVVGSRLLTMAELVGSKYRPCQKCQPPHLMKVVL